MGIFLIKVRPLPQIIPILVYFERRPAGLLSVDQCPISCYFSSIFVRFISFKFWARYWKPIIYFFRPKVQIIFEYPEWLFINSCVV